MVFRMTHSSPDERAYIEGLEWRKDGLQARVKAVRDQIEALDQEAVTLRHELASVEHLLSAVGASGENQRDVSPLPATGDAVGGLSAELSAWGPTARRIYTVAHQVIEEAGVPLHYRLLADEIQKTVPLSGADPGATLIAHLHRAPDLFPRVGRGVYALSSMIAPGTDTDSQPRGDSSTTRKRRTRVRRRTK